MWRLSTIKKKKLSILQKFAVGSAIFFFIVGVIVGSVILFSSFEFEGLAKLVIMGIFLGGLFGSILIGSYLQYRFEISNERFIN